MTASKSSAESMKTRKVHKIHKTMHTNLHKQVSMKNLTQQYSLSWLFVQGTHNVISRVAFVTTQGTHIMPPATAVWHQGFGIWYSR